MPRSSACSQFVKINGIRELLSEKPAIFCSAYSRTYLFKPILPLIRKYFPGILLIFRKENSRIMEIIFNLIS